MLVLDEPTAALTRAEAERLSVYEDRERIAGTDHPDAIAENAAADTEAAKA